MFWTPNWAAWLRRHGLPCKANMKRRSYSYSCLMAKLTEPLAEQVKGFGLSIPEHRIFNDSRGEKGRADEPHITIKYGIHTVDPAAVMAMVDWYVPLKATLGKTTVFWNDDSIVLKVSVQSRDLTALNTKIRRELECTDTYPDYKPHVTLAYVKKDETNPYWFKKYQKNIFDGMEIELDELVFTTPGGNR